MRKGITGIFFKAITVFSLFMSAAAFGLTWNYIHQMPNTIKYNKVAFYENETPKIIASLPEKKDVANINIPIGTSSLKTKNILNRKIGSSTIMKPIGTSTLKAILANKKWGSQSCKIAIIIDDAGYSMNGTMEKLLKLSEPLTISILPDEKCSRQIAEQAYKKGFEVMVHMPMQDSTYTRSSYKWTIMPNMSQEMVKTQIQGAINSIPYATGLNNHMGSKVTENKEVMSYCLDAIKERGFYFVDSLTSSRSVAYKLAKDKGLYAGRRDIFLDNENSSSYVSARMNELIALAKRKGYAIGIGHVTKQVTANVLAEMLPQLKKENIEIVPASALVD